MSLLMPCHALERGQQGDSDGKMEQVEAENEREVFPMKMLFPSHTGTLADGSWNTGFVCSLDKQEASRSLAYSPCLTVSLFNTNIYTHKICWQWCIHRKKRPCNNLENKVFFSPIPIPFYSLAAWETLSHWYSIHTFSSFLQNTPIKCFPGGAMITRQSSKSLQGLIPFNTCVGVLL